MSTTVEIPSFNWSAQFYPQILEALVQFKRTNCPELTNESAEEPLTQMLRAFALVGHLNNTLVDLVSNEGTLPTAKLPETVRNMLRLIDYTMSPASPAQADVVFELSQVFTSAMDIISAYSQVGTERTAEQASIPYENVSVVSAERTDQISSVLAYDDSEASKYTDYTTEANDATPGQEFTAWGTTPQSKDALYIGHESVEWDKLNVDIDTPGAGLTGVWEYHDGDVLDAKPTTLKRVGSTLRLGVNGVVGTDNRVNTKIRVQLDSSGSYEDEVESLWGDPGSEWGENRNYIETTGLLGQTTGEADLTTVDDYTVGCLWKELPDVTDGTVSTKDLEQDGDVSFTLPESLTHNWQKTTIQGVEAYWMRYRVISVSTPTSPIFDQLRIDTGKQYVKVQVTQGQRQNDSTLKNQDGADGNGEPDQRFQMTKDYFVWDSESVTVAGESWTRVDNFLQSRPTSRHYVIELGDDDRATIVFGDGTRGAKPTGTVACVYRWGANEDGSAGANTITRDNSGISFVSSLWNPRAATGWQESQTADEESLELAKIEGPASLRIVNVALGPDDIVTLAKAYTDASGSRPFVRALPIEEGFGPKTVELVVVAAGGGAASSTQLSALDEYFNGDQFANPPVVKALVANQEVTATNYTPKTINITADVYGDVSAATIQDYLTALIQPETKKADGVTFEWVFGEDIEVSRITHEIFECDANIYKVENVLLNAPTPADPDNVTYPAPGLKMEIDNFLGATDKSGTPIKVTLDSTGAYENVTSAWDGSSNYILTSGTLGQGTSPSTTASNYTISQLPQDVELEARELPIAGTITITVYA